MVAAAEINVTPWSVRDTGELIDTPAANPKYCYEWAFGGMGSPIPLCVWHADFRVSNDSIEYKDNMRQAAIKLERAAEDQYKPRDVRNRAKSQARRARRFDLLMQQAWRGGLPSRVITLAGNGGRKFADPGVQSAIVDYRLIDSMAWYVQAYSDLDGSYRMVREIVPPSPPMGDVACLDCVDQFAIYTLPMSSIVSSEVYERSGSVRRAALIRAAGKCEVFSVDGFVLDTGARYLETHHVVPLSRGGPDEEWNVAAICPNDHRRVHYGKTRGGLRSKLVDRLSRVYLRAKSALQVLSKSLQDD